MWWWPRTMRASSCRSLARRLRLGGLVATLPAAAGLHRAKALMLLGETFDDAGRRLEPGAPGSYRGRKLDEGVDGRLPASGGPPEPAVVARQKRVLNAVGLGRFDRAIEEESHAPALTATPPRQGPERRRGAAGVPTGDLRGAAARHPGAKAAAGPCGRPGAPGRSGARRRGFVEARECRRSWDRASHPAPCARWCRRRTPTGRKRAARQAADHHDVQVRLEVRGRRPQHLFVAGDVHVLVHRITVFRYGSQPSRPSITWRASPGRLCFSAT